VGLPKRIPVSLAAGESTDKYPLPFLSKAAIEFTFGVAPEAPPLTCNGAAGAVVPTPRSPPVNQELPAAFIETVPALEALNKFIWPPLVRPDSVARFNPVVPLRARSPPPKFARLTLLVPEPSYRFKVPPVFAPKRTARFSPLLLLSVSEAPPRALAVRIAANWLGELLLSSSSSPQPGLASRLTFCAESSPKIRNCLVEPSNCKLIPPAAF